jgi:hypothetical protein
VAALMSGGNSRLALDMVKEGKWMCAKTECSVEPEGVDKELMRTE